MGGTSFLAASIMMRKTRRCGQATIEFALTLPVIVALILGLLLTGTGITNSINVNNAAEAGVQAAVDTLDKVNAALSCASPASYDCVQSAEDLVQAMVDAALPCTPSNNPACVPAVGFIYTNVLTWGVSYCAFYSNPLHPGCAIPPLAAVGPLLSATNPTNCVTAPTCHAAVDDLTEAITEASLGCTTTWDDCPPPLSPTKCSGGAMCHPPPICSPPQCKKPVMLELVGGMAQLGLACAAVRRSLQLDTSMTTCQEGHSNANLGGQTDMPWVDIVYVPGGLPFVPFNCVQTGPIPSAELLEGTCPPGQTFVEKLTVHYKPPNSPSMITATATAVPASQFVG